MTPHLIPPPLPEWKFKTFGPAGEPYEIIRYTRQLASGHWMVEVRLVSSGELAEYELTALTDDPAASKEDSNSSL